MIFKDVDDVEQWGITILCRHVSDIMLFDAVMLLLLGMLVRGREAEECDVGMEGVDSGKRGDKVRDSLWCVDLEEDEEDAETVVEALLPIFFLSFSF